MIWSRMTFRFHVAIKILSNSQICYYLYEIRTVYMVQVMVNTWKNVSKWKGFILHSKKFISIYNNNNLRKNEDCNVWRLLEFFYSTFAVFKWWDSFGFVIFSFMYSFLQKHQREFINILIWPELRRRKKYKLNFLALYLLSKVKNNKIWK